MLELTDLRSPAWRKVVEELSAPAAADPVFLVRLVALLGQVTSARAALLYAAPVATGQGPDAEAPSGEPSLEFIWPTPQGYQQGQRPDASMIEHESEARDAATSAAREGAARAFSLDEAGMYYADQRKGTVLALPVVGVAPAPGSGYVVSLLLEPRSQQAMQTTVALAEIVVGYARGHAARQDLLRVRAGSMALDLAARLIASVNQAPGFRGACIALCNDLQRQLGVDRVALGWVHGIGKASGAIRVKSISDTEHLDRRLAMVRKIELAMDECLDQRQAVLYPPPPDQATGAEHSADSPDVLLAQAITHEHKQLASGDASLRVASVPLRAGDEVVGVLTVESAADGKTGGAPLNAGVVEWLQASMDLVAPVLQVRRSDDRNLALRAAHSTVKAGSWAVGPRHTVWKLVAIALFITISAAFIVHIPYNIEAPAELKARTQRVVSAPFGAQLEMVPDQIRPGAVVEAGQLLARMDTRDIDQALAQSTAELLLVERKVSALLATDGGAELEQAVAEADALRATVNLYRNQIERAEIRAPISGIIAEGAQRERIGSTVTMGDALFVIADINDLVAIAKVDDSDISYAQRSTEGAIALRADPDIRIPVTIDRIVPLAQADSGTNRFETHLELTDPQPWLRPGMEGLVKIDTGDRSVAWILSRRIRETLRMWLWY